MKHYKALQVNFETLGHTISRFTDWVYATNGKRWLNENKKGQRKDKNQIEVIKVYVYIF